jgi:hypothetical protein
LSCNKRRPKAHKKEEECAIKQYASAIIDVVVVTMKKASILEKRSALAVFTNCHDQMANVEACEYL